MCPIFFTFNFHFSQNHIKTAVLFQGQGLELEVSVTMDGIKLLAPSYHCHCFDFKLTIYTISSDHH